MNDQKQSIINSLKQSHLFTSLSDNQIDHVCNHCKIIKLKEGQRLFSQGDDVDYFYMVHTGKLKLYRVSPDGQEKIIEIIKAGEVFAEALMFMDQPHYPVNSSALTQTDLIAIHTKTFKEMLSGSVETCMKLLGDMSFRLHQLINEIDTLTLHSGTCRVASYLLHNMPNNKQSFELDVAKSVIAARLSVKPETFSRITRRLRDKGVLSIDGNTITIHNRNALKELSLV